MIGIYEWIGVSSWLETWYTRACHSPNPLSLGFSPHHSCPTLESSLPQPDITILATKYLSQLLVGITSAVWVMSLKTIASFQKAYGRLIGRTPS